jgi:hypothetical protein
MKLLPWSVSISLGIPTLENKLIKALETVLASWSLEIKRQEIELCNIFFGQVYLMIYQSTVDLVLIAR